MHLSAYAGGADDLPPAVLQGFLDAVADGTAVVPAGTAHGKLVVTT